MLHIKICGLRRPEDIDMVNRLGPDYVGFVFAQSPRRVRPGEAAALCRMLRPEIGAVGVFADEPAAEVALAARACRLAAVQLHGSEDAEYIRSLRTLLPAGCRVWKAARVRGAGDIEAAQRCGADMLLLDAFAPDAAGGTGKIFDWSLAQSVSQPFFLAGGLNARNVEQAVRTAHPAGVDVSSGVESGGFKDPDRAAEFIRAARRCAG